MLDEPESSQAGSGSSNKAAGSILNGRMPFADGAPPEFEGRVRQWL
jgi:hypothetical protein